MINMGTGEHGLPEFLPRDLSKRQSGPNEGTLW
jgi:hypothetical protein